MSSVIPLLPFGMCIMKQSHGLLAWSTMKKQS